MKLDDLRWGYLVPGLICDQLIVCNWGGEWGGWGDVILIIIIIIIIIINGGKSWKKYFGCCPE